MLVDISQHVRRTGEPILSTLRGLLPHEEEISNNHSTEQEFDVIMGLRGGVEGNMTLSDSSSPGQDEKIEKGI